MRIFTTTKPAVSPSARPMLVISSWNFAANGIIFCCSSMFQALGNTWPTIGSSASAARSCSSGRRCGYRPSRDSSWCTSGTLSVASMFLQAVVSLRAAAPGVRAEAGNMDVHNGDIPDLLAKGVAFDCSVGACSRTRPLLLANQECPHFTALSLIACESMPNNSSMCLGSMMSAGDSAMMSPVVRISRPRSKHLR